LLLELSIRNVALIERLRIEFEPGLNVLTGETGAGKSIVVDSVNLALGARAARDLVRSGEEKAVVQAVFDLPEHVAPFLEELGVETGDGLVALTREVTSAGRSLSRINGQVVPAAQLKQVTALLMDVHGQHEHQALLNPQLHRDFLDDGGDDTHRGLLLDVAERYTRFRALEREAEKLRLDERERVRTVDALTRQIDEIRAVKPRPGEDEKLAKKLSLYEHGEKIAQAVGSAYAFVYRGEGRALAAQDALSRAASEMTSIADLDPRFEALRARLEELFIAAQDAGAELQRIRDTLDYDPAAAERAADRLQELKRLKRLYGPELSDVLDFYEKAKARLEALTENEALREEAEKKRDEARAALVDACRALTDSRRALSEKLSARLVEQLSDLGMGRTRFEVEMRPCEPTAHGADEIQFLISPNPGEPVKPLAAIASGGELSRIMMAFKAIAANEGGVSSMIFDEVDTGVSGRMAQAVGEKMAQIAKNRQVICVTHLPQIAALANAHYLVEKTVVGGRTGSTVRKLDREGRVEEISRLVGGAGDPESSRLHAKNLLDAAQALVGTR
jgi:DNA repair protein RecN (Recombination protein N)